MLLDAGAGPDWRYRDQPSGLTLRRSEGLAVASFRMFEAGGFSAEPENDPLSADAGALGRLDEGRLAGHFQAGPGNPLVGLACRAELLRALGREIEARPEIYGQAEGCRPGRLYDHLKALATGGLLSAGQILIQLLATLNGAWPSGLQLCGVALGDVGRHSKLRRRDASDGLVPFHKLSQWLSYSLIEPLEAAGIQVVELDRLTGLAEYRNGGLFLDTGVLAPRRPEALCQPQAPGAEIVVEWRALTVALLDRLAERVRRRLDRSAAELPLAAVLQGGSWAAGRALAEKRRDGRPPLEILSDGTLF